MAKTHSNFNVSNTYKIKSEKPTRKVLVKQVVPKKKKKT